MASATNPFETDILQQVLTLPRAARLSLASKIIQSLEQEEEPGNAESTDELITGPALGSITNLIGIWKDVQPPPTDEEIKQILEDERVRKFGV